MAGTLDEVRSALIVTRVVQCIASSQCDQEHQLLASKANRAQDILDQLLRENNRRLGTAFSITSAYGWVIRYSFDRQRFR